MSKMNRSMLIVVDFDSNKWMVESLRAFAVRGNSPCTLEAFVLKLTLEPSLLTQFTYEQHAYFERVRHDRTAIPMRLYLVYLLLRCSFQNSTVFRIVAKAFGRYVCIFASNYLAISSYFLISFSIRQTRPCTHRYATTMAIALPFNVYLFIFFFSPIYSKRPLQNSTYVIRSFWMDTKTGT